MLKVAIEVSHHSSQKEKGSAVCVTVAVLVNCECELQYLPNVDVAKLAVTTHGWQ